MYWQSDVRTTCMEMEGADHRQGTEERMTGQQQHLLQMGKHVSIQLLGCVQLFVTPWTAAHKASLSITNSWSLLKLISIELVIPSNHLILCRPLLLLPQSFPALGSFPKGQFFASHGRSAGAPASASVLPMNTQNGFLQDWLVWFPCSPRDTQESSPTPQFKASILLLMA